MLKRITCIEDLRKIAKRRVPKMFYDYADSGSWTESTYRDNECAFQKIKFRQRVAVNLENRTTESTLLGEKVRMPLALAPVGSCGMQWADGEILSAQAAEEFGVPFVLSTVSVASIEDVAERVQKPFWFQLYVMRDRPFLFSLLDRAKKAGCSALMITLDLQVVGQRHKDIKNGLTTPPKPTLPNLINLAFKPRWCLNMARTPRRTFRNIVGHHPNVKNIKDLSNWTLEQFDPNLNWQTLAEIRDYWQGKIILKGIMEEEDAIKAVELGADALVVSNHGGRQLDGAAATIDILPKIVDAVGDKIEVWLDGGVRSGQDILRAYALGAKGVLIGRPYIYGLGAYGKEGVTKALEILHKELDLTMAFCGHTSLKNVDKNILLPNTYPTAERFRDKNTYKN